MRHGFYSSFADVRGDAKKLLTFSLPMPRPTKIINIYEKTYYYSKVINNPPIFLYFSSLSLEIKNELI